MSAFRPRILDQASFTQSKDNQSPANTKRTQNLPLNFRRAKPGAQVNAKISNGACSNVAPAHANLVQSKSSNLNPKPSAKRLPLRDV